MAYSRIVNVEYRSEQDMEQFLENWKDWMPKHMPDAISRTMVKTGPTSSLLMAVYSSSQVAENAREMVEVFFAENRDHMLDIIAFHGEVIEFD
jgi:dsDNA-binding SOS-regulon protein|tara:strand:- start:4 stop:282 length:279 start_codon:yes stop_codon:yes gene_type:complete